MESKFYWLKLPKNFLKRHDIVFIRSLPDGDKIVLFYLQLMLESVDHDGELRFSKTIPYSNKMLASVTNTPEEVVNLSMETLTELGMVEIAEDKTIRVPKVVKMIGSASDTDGARRMRRLREQRANEMCEQANILCEQTEQKRTNSNESKSKSKSKSYIERNTKERKFIPPTLEEVTSYCRERNNDVDAERFVDFYASKGWKIGSNSMKDWKAAVRTWEKNRKPSHCEPTTNKYDINWDEV